MSKEYSRKYNSIHKWMLRNYPKTGICEHCNQSTKTQWSNKDNQYQRIREQWQELCISCHRTYDRENRHIMPLSINTTIQHPKYYRKRHPLPDWLVLAREQALQQIEYKDI